eukprot:COSAG01_NODE_20854_length_931_cov_22.210337_2_plen_92_part_00
MVLISTARPKSSHTALWSAVLYSCYNKWRQTGLSMDRAATAVEGQNDITHEEAETMMDEIDAELWDYQPDGVSPTHIQPEEASDSTVGAPS